MRGKILFTHALMFSQFFNLLGLKFIPSFTIFVYMEFVGKRYKIPLLFIHAIIDIIKAFYLFYPSIKLYGLVYTISYQFGFYYVIYRLFKHFIGNKIIQRVGKNIYIH